MILIADFLSRGKENARPGREVCQVAGVGSRELVAAVERERLAGAPICAVSGRKHHGYYLAANCEEMEEYCRRLEHREQAIRKTLRACRRTSRKLAPKSTPFKPFPD